MALPSEFLIFTGSSSIDITCGLNSEKKKKQLKQQEINYYNKSYTKLPLKDVKSLSLQWKK